MRCTRYETWSYGAAESQPRTGEGMMAVFERKIRFADNGTEDQGMSKKRHNAGFVAGFADFDEKKGRMDTQDH